MNETSQTKFYIDLIQYEDTIPINAIGRPINPQDILIDDNYWSFVNSCLPYPFKEIKQIRFE